MKILILSILSLTTFSALASSDVQICSTIAGRDKNEMSCEDTRDFNHARKMFKLQTRLRYLKDQIKAKGLSHKWEEYRKTNPQASAL